ncbi:MAG: hypothetical protein AAGH87_02420 [Pseudomonadota bacterium]
MAALAAAWPVAGPGASAQLADRVAFFAGPQIVVWQAGAPPARGAVVDVAPRPGPRGAPLAGRLVPAALGAAEGETLTLKIASNSGFTVSAEGAARGAWDVTADLVAVGPRASGAGAGGYGRQRVAPGDEVDVFSAAAKTAQHPGTAADQALTVEITLEPVSSAAPGPLPHLSIVAGR